MAYEHTNGKGVKYYLHKSEVTLRGGKPQTIYFFTKQENGGKGTPCDLPADRMVVENPRKIALRGDFLLVGVLGLDFCRGKSLPFCVTRN